LGKIDFLSQFDRNFHAPHTEPHTKNRIITPKISLISSFTPNKCTTQTISKILKVFHRNRYPIITIGKKTL
jgi:hypothetical protein